MARQLLLKGAVCILVCLSLTAKTQSFTPSDSTRSPSFKDHLFYGGSLGLNFGTVTLIDISPMIGYKITPRIGVGVSPTYKYYAVRNYYGNDPLKTNIFGGSVFGRVLILDQLFAHAEYEYLIYNIKEPGSSLNTSIDFQSVFVGAGYREQVARNAYMYLMVLWNLNETIDSPYTNPVIRAGFSIGF